MIVSHILRALAQAGATPAILVAAAEGYEAGVEAERAARRARYAANRAARLALAPKPAEPAVAGAEPGASAAEPEPAAPTAAAPPEPTTAETRVALRPDTTDAPPAPRLLQRTPALHSFRDGRLVPAPSGDGSADKRSIVPGSGGRPRGSVSACFA